MCLTPKCQSVFSFRRTMIYPVRTNGFAWRTQYSCPLNRWWITPRTVIESIDQVLLILTFHFTFVYVQVWPKLHSLPITASRICSSPHSKVILNNSIRCSHSNCRTLARPVLCQSIRASLVRRYHRTARYLITLFRNLS